MTTAATLSSSSMLWAHLQRKDPTVPNTSNTISLPPMAPLDKTSTSLRILLHDTQSQFETFSEKVNVLTTGVDSAKREIGKVKTLFEKEREEMAGEIYSLANRCQSEIMKAVGEPAQTSVIANLENDVRLRLEGLDKRVDSMQMLYQANAQTLQAQTQLLQAIQEQQGTLLSALLPLLPLLQAVPLHIDKARNSVQEAISQAFVAAPVPHPPITRSATPIRPLNQLPAKSPLSSRKRRRIDENNSDTLHPPSSDERRQEPPPPRSLNIIPGRRSLHNSNAHTVNHANMNALKGLTRNNRSVNPVRTPFANLDPKTPRRPLAELSLASANNPARKMSFNQRPSSVFAPTPNPSRIPQLLVSSAAAQSTPKLVQHAHTRTHPPTTSHITQHSTPRGVKPYPVAARLTPASTNFMPPSSLRQRRSPFRQGRRFIPLDDSDDSDADGEGGTGASEG